MKKFRIIALIAIVAMLFGLVGTAAAQLGDTDISSFTVQNIDSTSATVTISFYAEDGTVTTPTVLNSGKANPFTLAPGESWEVYVPGIPSSQLPNGRFSVVISSTAEVVGIANLVGQGSINFNGSYSGFSSGGTTFYLPAAVFNYFGWYSLISVQNVGPSDANIDLTITCSNGTTGTLSATGVKQFASHHFDLETTTPSGFTSGTSCNGSAKITSNQPIVAVDNQTLPTGGNTQSFSGVMTGYAKLYAPALYNNYFGWNASLNIRKLGTGNTTVTVSYSDGGSSTCNLTDAQPGCLLYIPSEHPATGYFGATIQASPSMNLIAVVNAANGSQAQTYNAIGTGTGTVGIPSVMKSYFGWNTSFTCQNISSSTSTSLNVKYDGYSSNAYNTPSLAPGATWEKVTSSESFLPSGFQGGATITANTVGANISCIVNFNNGTQMGSTLGDWSMSYNAFNK